MDLEFKDVLGDSYIDLDVTSINVNDAFDGCNVIICMTDFKSIEGNGVGLVDSVFNAFKDTYSTEYESLKTIKLFDFNVKILKSLPTKGNGLDVKCEITLQFLNSYGRLFMFESSGSSLAFQSALAVSQGVQHFINAERAYIALYKALKDAHERNRQDLVARFTSEMAYVVRNTSYADIIERIENEISRSQNKIIAD